MASAPQCEAVTSLVKSESLARVIRETDWRFYVQRSIYVRGSKYQRIFMSIVTDAKDEI